jgi:hypothetical protein
MPFAWAAGAAALGTIGGALISSNGAQDAANTEANAANNASQVQLQMFNQTQANEQPYLQAGNNSLAALLKGVGVGPGTANTGSGPLNAPFTAAQYQQSPGYQFQMNQGLNAINNTASARGGVNSGNTLKSLTQYGTGLANQDYQQAYQNYVAQQNQQFGQLQTLAGSGQNAAANLGALGSQVGSSVGSNIIGAGNASAAGQVATANTIGNSLNSLGSNYLLYNALNGGGSAASGGIGISNDNPDGWG